MTSLTGLRLGAYASESGTPSLHSRSPKAIGFWCKWFFNKTAISFEVVIGTNFFHYNEEEPKIVAMTEFEHESVRLEVESFISHRRPPEHLRDRIDLSYSWDRSEVVIYELRPRWDDASVIIQENVARAKYIKAKKKWKVYWQRADLKWHIYPPKPEVTKISEFLSEVSVDPHGCFWG